MQIDVFFNSFSRRTGRPPRIALAQKNRQHRLRNASIVPLTPIRSPDAVPFKSGCLAKDSQLASGALEEERSEQSTFYTHRSRWLIKLSSSTAAPHTSAEKIYATGLHLQPLLGSMSRHNSVLKTSRGPPRLSDSASYLPKPFAPQTGNQGQCVVERRSQTPSVATHRTQPFPKHGSLTIITKDDQNSAAMNDTIQTDNGALWSQDICDGRDKDGSTTPGAVCDAGRSRLCTLSPPIKYTAYQRFHLKVEISFAAQIPAPRSYCQSM